MDELQELERQYEDVINRERAFIREAGGLDKALSSDEFMQLVDKEHEIYAEIQRILGGR